MSPAVVVGGGISGILAALLLRARGEDVTLLERNETCGGLLRSWTSPDGHVFDYGTHIIQETGIPGIDRLLFDWVDDGRWHTLHVLKNGNYFGGSLNERSPFIDASRLPEAVYRRGVVDLLCASPGAAPAANAQQSLQASFGATFSDAIMAPVLRKLFGCSLEELHPDAHRLFGLTRLLALGPETSRELKKLPRLDAVLAFHSYREGRGSLRHFYPKSGGIGQWVEAMVGKLRASGVQLATGAQVRKVTVEGRRVRAIVLSDGREVALERLVWTLPAAALLGLTEGESSAARPPALRRTSLFHFVFDRPFRTDLHFLNCYDPDMAAFRVTLYPNIGRGEGEAAAAPYRCTVEVLSGDAPDGDALLRALPEELVRMGVVPAGARAVAGWHDAVGAGFPVLSLRYAAQSADALARARERYDNVHFLGKGQGGAFFVSDVLRETFDTLEAS